MDYYYGNYGFNELNGISGCRMPCGCGQGRIQTRYPVAGNCCNLCNQSPSVQPFGNCCCRRSCCEWTFPLACALAICCIMR